MLRNYNTELPAELWPRSPELYHILINLCYLKKMFKFQVLFKEDYICEMTARFEWKQTEGGSRGLF
jgi:hypothetical protein